MKPLGFLEIEFVVQHACQNTEDPALKERLVTDTMNQLKARQA